MCWLTNGAKQTEEQYMVSLVCGHEGKREIRIGDPKPGKYTVAELVGWEIQGYYEVRPCQCAICKERRKEKYYQPLEDWRKMNEEIISRKEEERRAAIRREHTYPPITHRIVLDMGVDNMTRIQLCAFAGRVVAITECSNMLGYAMGIKRSEEPETETQARQVYYDLIIDGDVSPPIEGALTELMGTIHTTARDMGLIGEGLNIINMEASE